MSQDCRWYYKLYNNALLKCIAPSYICSSWFIVLFESLKCPCLKCSGSSLIEVKVSYPSWSLYGSFLFFFLVVVALRFSRWEGDLTLSNLHQGQQASLQLWKIENVLQQEIRESMHLQSNGAHSFWFNTWLICKVNYAIYWFIKFFKTIFSECHVWCCTSIKQPTIFVRWKRSHFIKSKITMCNNTRIRKFTSILVICLLVMLIFDGIPWSPTLIWCVPSLSAPLALQSWSFASAPSASEISYSSAFLFAAISLGRVFGLVFAGKCSTNTRFQRVHLYNCNLQRETEK